MLLHNYLRAIEQRHFPQGMGNNNFITTVSRKNDSKAPTSKPSIPLNLPQGEIHLNECLMGKFGRITLKHF